MESYRTRQDYIKHLAGDSTAALRMQRPVLNGAGLAGVVMPAGRRTNSILSRLDIVSHRGLFRALKPVELKKDQFLFQQGEKPDFVYFPETAVVSKFHILEDGRTIEVEVTGSEGALGVTSVFNSSPAINCAQVCVSGSAFKVEREVVLAEASKSPELNALLYEQIRRQLTNLSQKVICNTFHHVDQRLATWLLVLDDRCTGEYLSMTQEHIARVLGVHRPSVTYIAQELRNKRLIDYVRGRIYIRDRRGLEKVACVCYSDMHSV
jgi:CRP-like cAMP-binding protein